MKLAKIKEDLYLNPHNVVSIEFDDEDNTTRITMVGGDAFLLDLPIKKVLDAICGSEEHLEDSDNKYNISVTTDNTGINKIGTKSAVLHYLNKLRADEKLTIKTVI
ncbi:hypothetical protein [Pediococcus acidilactici]|uniref:hypothetical protein n=1 Tax=Pediococcus acidilactici TaxID=1254 RepID=UPI003CF1CC7D